MPRRLESAEWGEVDYFELTIRLVSNPCRGAPTQDYGLSLTNETTVLYSCAGGGGGGGEIAYIGFVAGFLSDLLNVLVFFFFFFFNDTYKIVYLFLFFFLFSII